MSDTYTASTFLADFSAAVAQAKSVDALNKVGSLYSGTIERHGVRDICLQIYKYRKLEIAQADPAGSDSGGAG